MAKSNGDEDQKLLYHPTYIENKIECYDKKNQPYSIYQVDIILQDHPRYGQRWTYQLTDNKFQNKYHSKWQIKWNKRHENVTANLSEESS